MSTLSVGTIKSNTTSPPAIQNSSGTEIGTLCRAWVNFNGTGTVAIRAGFNVTSITDHNTGEYTVNFTNSLANANYSPQFSINSPATSTVGIISQLAASVRFLSQTSGVGDQDFSIVTVAVFG